MTDLSSQLGINQEMLSRNIQLSKLVFATSSRSSKASDGHCCKGSIAAYSDDRSLFCNVHACMMSKIKRPDMSERVCAITSSADHS